MLWALAVKRGCRQDWDGWGEVPWRVTWLPSLEGVELGVTTSKAVPSILQRLNFEKKKLCVLRTPTPFFLYIYPETIQTDLLGCFFLRLAGRDRDNGQVALPMVLPSFILL